MTSALSLHERAVITSRLLSEARARPYVPGVNDCFFLGLRQIDAIRGTEHEAAHKGIYTTIRGANRALRRRGHTTLATYFAGILEPIAWGSARIGDVAIVEVDGDEHVGLHGGLGWQSITGAGPARWHLSQAKQAFRV